MSTLADPPAGTGGTPDIEAPHLVATEAVPDLPVRLQSRRVPAPRTVLAIASIGVFVAFVDSTIVNIAFPSIEHSFPGAGDSGVSWVLSAYNLVFAAFLIAGGRIADLLGRRRLFSFSLALFTIASAACAAAPTLALLIVARMVQAIAAALLIPSSLGLVLAGFEEKSRSHAVALWAAAGAAAAGVGPSLGGLLISADSWRLVFLVNVPIGLVGWVLAGRGLVESRAPGRRRVPDLPGAVLLAAASALLLLGIVQGRSWGWSGGRVLGAFALAVVLGAGFAWRCATHRDPMIDPRLLRVRSFSVANAMTLVSACGYYGYTLCNVLFLTTVWHYSILKAGLALTPGPFVAVAIAGVSSRVAEKLGPRAVVVPGGLIWAGAVIWMVEQVGTAPEFVSQWLPGMVLLGVGAGLVLPNLSSASVAAAPSHAFATASALNSVARQVGAAVGVALTVTIIGSPAPAAAFGAFHHAWIFGSACLGAGALGFLGIGALHGEHEGETGMLPSLGASTRAVLAAAPFDAPSPAPARTSSAGAATRPAIERQAAETVTDFLARVPIFSELPPALLEQLANRSRSRAVRAGEWLIRGGEIGETMYVVRAGRLHVVQEANPGDVIREAGRGDAVGELALLTRQPRSASVRAARDTDVIEIGRETFDALLERSPLLYRAVSHALALQLRAFGGTRRVRPVPGTIAVVGLGPQPGLVTFAHGLATALGVHRSVGLLDTSERSGGALAEFGPLLDRCEQVHDQVILLGGDALGADPWTKFCIQQADRILAVTGGGSPPDGFEDRPELRGCDLVACGVRPGTSQVAGWGAVLAPQETHALPEGQASPAGLARIARRLSGKSVGLVLSGGGARALAHIGVIEELLAAGIEIDRVAGVSMGAYIAALLAMGLSPTEIDARCYEEWVRHKPLSDYTLPRSSLIRGDRFVSMLERSFGALAIEELERGFFCTAADLRSSELHVLRHGSLVDTVSSSMCLPLLSAPLVSGRKLMIDGSLIDNLPVEPMAALGEGPIIAVDVKATFERSSSSNGQRPPAGRIASPERRSAPGRVRAETASGRLRQRLSDGGRWRPPRFGETLTRLFLLASSNTTEAAKANAELLITPRNPGLGLLEFHQIDAAREAGRRAAREALEQAPASLFG